MEPPGVEALGGSRGEPGGGTLESPHAERVPARSGRGRLFVISAPSGAGKTSLVKALLARDPALRLSISHTTRKPRPQELDGREYFFVSVPEFEALVARGAFLEHARVFDNYYGTSRETVERLLAAGTDVVLEIDWQGAQQVRAALPESVTVFLLPPSRRALEERLTQRQTDSAEVIARRLRDAVGDMRHFSEFDYVVVNDRFEQAIAELQSIFAGRGDALRRDRSALQPLLAELLSDVA
jgi:guanylate kinase